MVQYFPVITGSLTVTGSVFVSGSITATGGVTISGSIASSSYASNAERLDNLDSTSFVFTSSYNQDSSSLSGRVTTIESKYATTGSNIFTANQTICGNLTTTGTITAQTINVQQVTSSIVYSSGSNIFGCSLSNTQQFTGSMLITGSNFTANVTNACFLGQVCSNTLSTTDGSNVSQLANNYLRSTAGNFYFDACSVGASFNFRTSNASALDNTAMFICGTNSRVGIGTTSPAQKLEISSGHAKFSDSYGLFYGTQTQLYGSEASKYFRFDIAGTSGVMFLSGSGNVGVGTTDPQSILSQFSTSVRGIAVSNAYPFIAFNDTDGCNFFVGTQACLAYLWNLGNDAMIFGTCNTERMRITSGGNVGIGTTSPCTKFDMRNGNMMIVNTTTVSATTGGPVISLGETSSEVGMSGGISFAEDLDNNPTRVTMGIYYDGSANKLHIVGACDASTVGQSMICATKHLTVLRDSGNVGIGTSSPTFPLTVNKTGIVATGNAYNIAQFRDASADKGVDLGYDNTSQTGIILSGTTGTASNLAFWTYTGSAWGERMRITSGGNVGIGTGSPNIGGVNKALTLNAATSTNASYELAVNDVLQGSLYTGISSSSLNLYTFVNGPLVFGTNSTERMRIASTGETCFACIMCVPRIYMTCSTSVYSIAGNRTLTVNTTTYQDTGINQSGLLIVNNNADAAAAFVFNARGASASIVKIGDPQNCYSTVCNCNNAINIFPNASGNLILQNCSGTSRNFSLMMVGTA